MEKCYYYVDNCPDGTEKDEAKSKIDWNLPDCTDASITATWDPAACPEQNTGQCDVSGAVQLAIDFVIRHKDNPDTGDVCT